MSLQSHYRTSTLISHDNIEEALCRSEYELACLACFYHEQGLVERAGELYRAMLGIRKDRAKQPGNGN